MKMKSLVYAFGILVAIYFFATHGYLRLLDPDGYKRNVSQFVSLNNADEYVIAELVTNESFAHKQCTKTLINICIAWATFNISFDAHYKYYIKLNELKYSVEGDALVFEIPELYLSTPVGIDTANSMAQCQKTLLGNCNKVITSGTQLVSQDLITKGNQSLPSVYDKAANSLANHFNEFQKDKLTWGSYKNIHVSFLKENSSSRRAFNFN
jgi:hypothetical protein